MAVRLLVADDDAEVRLLLKMGLGRQNDFEIVGEATDGLAAAQLAADHDPDVVVLDWRMPGIGGLEAIPLIRRASPHCRILMYSSQPSPQAEEEALGAGADGYLEKTAGITALVSAIRGLAGAENELPH